METEPALPADVEEVLARLADELGVPVKDLRANSALYLARVARAVYRSGLAVGTAEPTAACYRLVPRSPDRRPVQPAGPSDGSDLHDFQEWLESWPKSLPVAPKIPADAIGRDSLYDD